MSTTAASGSAVDLNDSRAEALHALLSSLSLNTSDSNEGDGKLSAEQVRKISNKLGEILGNDVEKGDSARRNEKGELLNEEGLPIIDINEPVSASDTAEPDQFTNFDDPDLLPLWALSPAEKARRKAERERILDEFEEEERLEQLRDTEAARARWHEEMEKRKEAAKTEIENLKRARELQKKMGRALLRSVVEGRNQEEKEKLEMEKADQEAASKKLSLKPKKSVSFVEEPIEAGSSTSSKDKDVDWGDVTPGRLRAKSELSSLMKDRTDKLPMKMHVVERHPRALQSPEPSAAEGDSDDESIAGSLVAADSEDGEVLYSDHISESEDEGQHSPLSGSDEEDGLPVDEELEDWGGEDFDYARHQREVAMEYYEKRKTIGAEASGALRAHTHYEDEWNQPEVPLEATLASVPPKPSISRFKAEHSPLTHSSTSTLASHSLSGSVLPSSQSTSLKSAVRMGKLQDGKLLGGEEGDSDGDIDAEDENARAMLEMLRRGEVTNIGPTSQSSVAEVPRVQVAKSSEGMPAQPAGTAKASKFKLSLSQPMPAHASQPETDSLLSTPIMSAQRSSPKMASPHDGIPVAHTTLSSQHPKPARRQMPRVTEGSSYSPPPVVSRQQGASSMTRSASSQPAFHSVVLEPPSSSLQAITPTSLSPTSTVVPASTSERSSPVATPPALATPLRQTVMERRPPVVASSREPTARASTDEDIQTGGKPKMSRFKAGRSR